MNYVSHEGSALVELPALPTFDNLRGEQARRRFRGPPALIRAKFNSIKFSGVQTMQITEVDEGVALELVADYPGQVGEDGEVSPTLTPVITDWTLEPIEMQQSLWEYPPVLAEMAKLPTTDEGLESRRLIHSDIMALVSGVQEVQDRENPRKMVPLKIRNVLTAITTAGLDRTVFEGLIGDLLRGITGWTPEAWNLRRTRRIPVGHPFRESREGVGRFLTQSTLLSIEGFTDTALATSLPTGGYWLKKAPFDRPVGNGNREVTTDYVWSLKYSEFLYGAPL